MWSDIWKGRERQAVFVHFIGGIGLGLLISAWFGTFLGLGIILVLISAAGHYLAYQKTKEGRRSFLTIFIVHY